MMKPWFYDEFQCVAAKCTDNCCIGWEIDIDERAMNRFRDVPGEFGERLRGAVHGGEQPTFALSAGDRCALLREDGLCELILNCGEDSLCDICALHPRFFNDFGEVEEAGLGLCCEEVCRLLFSRSEPLKFLLSEDDIAAISREEGETAQLRRVRELLTEILQDRSLAVPERISKCAEYGWKVQEWLEGGDDVCLPELPTEWQDITSVDEIDRLFGVLSCMESINDEWTELFGRLDENRARLVQALPDYLSSTREEWRYEHIAVYCLYRNYTDCLSDGCVYARTMLSVSSALAVMLMDCLCWLEKGTITDWDRILDLKLYSKQVEYSQENIDAFLEEYR